MGGDCEWLIVMLGCLIRSLSDDTGLDEEEGHYNKYIAYNKHMIGNKHMADANKIKYRTRHILYHAVASHFSHSHRALQNF